MNDNIPWAYSTITCWKCQGSHWLVKENITGHGIKRNICDLCQGCGAIVVKFVGIPSMEVAVESQQDKEL